MDPTTGYVAISVVQLAQLVDLAGQRNREHDLEGMNYSFHDKSSGTTTTHQIDFRTDGNKIADAKGNTWLHVGANAGSEMMISGFIRSAGKELDLEIRNQEDYTPLMTAVEAGRQKIIEILLDNGADVNACRRESGRSVLHIAASKENLAIVDLLLSRGAKITEANTYRTVDGKFFESPVNRGFTPLLAAIRGRDVYEVGGSVELVKRLIDAGDNPHQITSDGWNALHYAARNVPVAKMLIQEYHVNPNQKSEDELTPLQLVLDPVLTQCLLEHGAEADSSFFHCWNQFKNADKIITLLKFGVNPNFPPLKEHPFAIFVDNLILIDIPMSKKREITTLFLKTGAKITFDMKDRLDSFLKNYPDQELKKIIEDNYSSDCTIL